MNKYVIDLIQARLDAINDSIHAIKEEKNSLQESLEKTNQTDLMYARLMHSIGEEYLKLAELYAEKIQLNNELHTSGGKHFAENADIGKVVKKPTPPPIPELPPARIIKEGEKPPKPPEDRTWCEGEEPRKPKKM